MKHWKWAFGAGLIFAAIFFYQKSQQHVEKIDSQEMASLAKKPAIGMFYFLWHCPVSSSKTHNPGQVTPDSSQANIGAQDWAGIPSFHWWTKPTEGFYCLTENEKLLTRHAELLRDAGIDFVFLDASNWKDRNKDATEVMVVQPFEKLMDVWSKIPGAPKVVPFVPVTAKGTLAPYFASMLKKYSNMAFQYKGKPLFLAVKTLSEPISQQYKDLEKTFSLRSMWGLLGKGDLDSGVWSFLQPCQDGFLAKKATTPCNQGVTHNFRFVEQASVSVAYQIGYMSNYDNAVPKFFGRTFLQQLESARTSGADIITITGWNEWIAQRFCPDGSVKCNVEHFPNGNRVFVDQYTYEYNRDLEPSVGEGNYYYDLLKKAIAAVKAGQSPIKETEGLIKTSAVHGVIDSIEANKDGSYNLVGWACAKGLNDSIAVHVYAGGVAGKGTFLSKGPANVTSEAAVATACEAKGANYRFRVAIPAALAKTHAGKTIHMYAISPYGYDPALLTRSGQITIPKK